MNLAVSAAAAPPRRGIVDDFTMTQALEVDNAATVAARLRAGLDPNAVDGEGRPLLYVAILLGSQSIARLLIETPGIDLDSRTPQDETPLMAACWRGDMPLVTLLVDGKGVEVNKPGWAPLHYAAAQGNLELARYLLDHAAYIDAESPNGTTPLMMAARSGNIRLVKLLLDEGADMRMRNQRGLTAIEFADQANQTEIADGLRSRLRKLEALGASDPRPAAAPVRQAR